MDQTKIDKLEQIATDLKTKAKETSPEPWQQSTSKGGAVDCLVCAGEEAILQVLRTEPFNRASANAHFTAYAHKVAAEVADGMLELITEVRRLSDEVQLLKRYQRELAKEDGKGFPKFGR